MSNPIGTYDPQANAWTATPAFVAYLDDDPDVLGFKLNGVFKAAAEIGLLLTSPNGTKANPVAQPQIPKPIGIGDLTAAAPQTLGTLAVSDLEPIAARVRASDRDGIQKWADVLNLKGVMPAAEHTAVTALVSAVIGDPSWAATVPGLSHLETKFGVGCVDHRLITTVTGVA